MPRYIALPDGYWWSGATKGPLWSSGPAARPDATNTGWQAAGANLTPYEGPTTLTTDQTIDSKIITGHIIAQANVTLTRCQITGRVDSDAPAYSATIEDCNIDAGQADVPGAGYSNLTIRRCNIINGANSVIGGDNTLIEDSWLHSQYLFPESDQHVNAFISNGGTGITLRNCVLHAEPLDNGFGGGVSTNCSLFGDAAEIRDVLIEDCLIKATPGAYGVSLGYNPGKLYGDNPTNVVFRNNTFERGASGNCGAIGPVTSWLAANGNEFTGNVWEDGAPVSPA